MSDLERTALDVHTDAADRAGHAPTVVDLDWTATAYRTTRAFAATVADSYDWEARVRAYIVGRLRVAVTTDGASDEQIGRFARGLVQALTDLRLDVHP